MSFFFSPSFLVFAFSSWSGEWGFFSELVLSLIPSWLWHPLQNTSNHTLYTTTKQKAAHYCRYFTMHCLLRTWNRRKVTALSQKARCISSCLDSQLQNYCSGVVGKAPSQRCTREEKWTKVNGVFFQQLQPVPYQQGAHGVLPCTRTAECPQNPLCIWWSAAGRRLVPNRSSDKRHLKSVKTGTRFKLQPACHLSPVRLHCTWHRTETIRCNNASLGCCSPPRVYKQTFKPH